MGTVKFGWFSILGMALCLMASCSVRRDRERIETAVANSVVNISRIASIPITGSFVT